MQLQEAYWKLYEETKFKAKLGGWRNQKILGDDFVFDDAGTTGFYWSGTRLPKGEVIVYQFRGDSGIEHIIQNSFKPRSFYGMSCRCVKDEK